MIRYTKLKEHTLLAVLTWMIALESLSIDLYLPAFLPLAESLKTSNGNVQISLALFLGGFALGQLVWGTLADKFGRKWPVIYGFILYTVASLLIANCSTVMELWVYRFFQALGGASGVVIARAIVIDVFPNNRVAKIFALLMLIMGIAPMLAPALGVFILAYWNWQGIFYTMALFGFIGLLLIAILLPETLPQELKNQKKHLGTNLLKEYSCIFKNRNFLMYTLSGSMAYCALMVYVANSPFLIIEKGAYSERIFSLIFGINGASLLIASILLPIVLRYISEKALINLAVMAMVLFGLLLVSTVLISETVELIILFAGLYIFALGFLLPTSTAMALTPFPTDSAGKASALLGFIQLAITTLITTMTGIWHSDSLLAFVSVLLASGLLALFAVKNSEKRPANLQARDE